MTLAPVRWLCSATLLAGLLGAAATVATAADEDKLKFEVYKDKAGEFRWRLKAANSSTLATGGQGYKAKADAQNGVELVKKSGTDAATPVIVSSILLEAGLSAVSGVLVFGAGLAIVGDADAPLIPPPEEPRLDPLSLP